MPLPQKFGDPPEDEPVDHSPPEEGVGAALIAAERARQMECEGWTTAHDAKHVNGEMALAAACYAVPAQHRKILPSEGYPLGWPPEWGAEWWKPAPISIVDQSGYEQPTAADRIRELSKAGALLAAEIDRLSLLRSDGPSTPRPVYDGDVSWRRIAGVGAAPEGAQGVRPQSTEDCPTCDGDGGLGGLQVGDVIEGEACPTCKGTGTDTRSEAGGTQPPSAFHWTPRDIGRLQRALQLGCEAMASAGEIAEPFRAVHAGNAALALAEAALARAAAVPEAGALEAAMRKGFAIAKDNARAETAGDGWSDRTYPTTSWEDAEKELEAEVRALSSPSGDARPDRFLEGWLAGRERVARWALDRIRYGAGDQYAAEIRNLPAPVAPSILEEPKSPIVDPKAASQKEEVGPGRKLAADARALVEFAEKVLAQSEEIARLTKEVQEARRVGLENYERMRKERDGWKGRADHNETVALADAYEFERQARAEAKALREALEQARARLNPDDLNDSFTEAACDIIDAALAPPNPSAEKLTPDPVLIGDEAVADGLEREDFTAAPLAGQKEGPPRNASNGPHAYAATDRAEPSAPPAEQEKK